MINWDKIEKSVIYISLVGISSIEIISAIFPTLISASVSNPITVSLTTLALLSLFKYISSKFESTEDIIRNTFTKSTNLLFEHFGKKEIKTLDLFVYTGSRYGEIICEKDISKIEHARIMFALGNKSEEYKTELSKQLVVWKSLEDRGIIKKLEVKFYNFEPSIYFCIIDKKYMNFGLIKPYRPRRTDMLKNAYIINKKEIDELIILDFLDYFDYFFETSCNNFIDINNLPQNIT